MALLEIDRAKHEELCVHLEAVLRELEERLQRHRQSGPGARGPYWHGERIGMVDLTYAPSLVRFAGLHKYHDWKLPEGLANVAVWVDMLRSEPLVRDTFYEEEVLGTVGGYLENFRRQAAS